MHNAEARVASASEKVPRKSRAQPNILVFLTDDHGQWLQQAYGNTEVHTPNLLDLARRGVLMENAYTTCPVCSPARASFFTGRMPSQHGIHDWLDESLQTYQYPWLKEEVLISELIQHAGYHTGLVGKWHCGQDRYPHRGFDEWYTYWETQYPHDGQQNFSDNGKQIAPVGFQSSLLSERAIGFLRGHFEDSRFRDHPFFLFVGYTDTHLPHEQMPEELVALYRRASFRDIPRETFPACHGKAYLPVSNDAAIERHKREQYYAAASAIDREVGRVLQALQALGKLNETMVIYTGDHGLNAGHHGMWEKGPATAPQNFLEESIRVGCTITWPAGGIPQGVSVNFPVNHCDLFATLLEVAGARPTAEQARKIHSPGRSYLSALRGEPAEPRRTSIVCEYGNAQMLLDNGYKLILRYPFIGAGAPNELYDLRADPRETVNLYDMADAEKKAVIDQMTRQLNGFFDEYTVPGRSGLDMKNQPTFNSASPWGRVVDGQYMIPPSVI